jgi:hypothetical protein
MKFVQHFGIISKPLNDLLKMNYVFVWTRDHEVAFQTLKSALIQAPVFALPYFSKPFCIETDASAGGVGAILMQDHHPIAYVSKALGPKMRGLSTYEKEYVAILLVIEHWRSYFHVGEFIIYTVQKSLAHLNEQRFHTSWQQYVFTKLLGTNYKVLYKKGIENRVVDALSRNPNHADDSLSCHALSVVQPKWLEEVVLSYESDAYSSDLMAKLLLDSS